MGVYQPQRRGPAQSPCNRSAALWRETYDVCAACRALPVWLGLGALHLGLGLALKLYFFQYWSS